MVALQTPVAMHTSAKPKPKPSNVPSENSHFQESFSKAMCIISPSKKRTVQMVSDAAAGVLRVPRSVGASRLHSSTDAWYQALSSKNQIEISWPCSVGEWVGVRPWIGGGRAHQVSTR